MERFMRENERKNHRHFYGQNPLTDTFQSSFNVTHNVSCQKALGSIGQEDYSESLLNI